MDKGIEDQNDKDVALLRVLGLLDEYHNYLNGHDIEGVISTIHSASPAQGPTRQILGQMFNVFRLKNEIVDTKYIGNDEDYVYIKMKQKITKITGPEFRDNISDSIVVARREGEAWKVWSMMPLEVTFCEMQNSISSFLM